MIRKSIRSVVIIGLLPALTPSLGKSQDAVVVKGVVLSAISGASLPYSTVSVGGGERRFSSADGTFSFLLSSGAHSFRVRQLGYSPLDTTLVIAAGAQAPLLVFRLQPVAIKLDPVRTYASACRAGSRDHDLGLLLDELTKNAEREKLLRTVYPFAYDLERKNAYEGPDGLRPQSTDTTRFLSTIAGGYTPGDPIRVVDSASNNGAVAMHIPALADLADPAFIDNHCFRYRGIVRVEGLSTYRIDFTPNESVRGADIEGSAYVDTASYLIRRVTFRLAHAERARPTVFGLEVTTSYREIFKGVAIFDKIHSVEKLTGVAGMVANEIQDQRLVAINFYGATPEGIVVTDLRKSVHGSIDTTARIAGVVVDSVGRRLSGAQVFATDSSVRTVTRDSGEFILYGLRPGRTEFTVRAIGFGPATFSTELRAGRTRRMRIILTPNNIQLATITVLDSLSDPLLAETGFFLRKRHGLGTFVGPDEIARRNPGNASDMLRMINGLDMQLVWPSGTIPVSTHSSGITGGRCVMNVIIDRLRINMKWGTTLEEVISGSELGAIEIYPTSGETPAEFLSFADDCGTIVIWTKGWLSAESQADSTKSK